MDGLRGQYLWKTILTKDPRIVSAGNWIAFFKKRRLGLVGVSSTGKPEVIPTDRSWARGSSGAKLPLTRGLHKEDWVTVFRCLPAMLR